MLHCALVHCERASSQIEHSILEFLFIIADMHTHLESHRFSVTPSEITGKHSLLDRFQSGFRAGHSTESARRLSNDILDSGSSVLLVLEILLRHLMQLILLTLYS